MHIVLIAIGSRGDVDPCVALGVGLRDAGHRVTVIIPRDLAHLATDQGLEALQAPFDAREVVLGADGRRWITEASRSKAAEMRHLTALMDGVAETAADTIELLPSDADLLISGVLTYDGAAALAEHRGIRHILATHLPITPTRDGRSCVFSALPDRESRLNLTAGTVAASAAYRIYAGAGRVIRERLGLPPNTLRQYWRTARSTPGLLAAGPTLVPPAPEWAPNVRQTGQWHLPSPSRWEPDADLAAFLDAGEPPVYLGFGSMASDDSEGAATRIIDAALDAGRRVVFAPGWSGLDPATLAGRGDVHTVGEVPHAALFGRVSAVIHHGGAGTTATATRAGVPQWVVPHIGDQPYWGRRIAQLGIGPEPVVPHRITADSAAAAMRTLGDPATGHRARDVGDRVRFEPGVERAVELINGYLNHC